MKPPADHFDVIILGGGPAGTCAALRLLELGYEVALLIKLVNLKRQKGKIYA